MEKAGQYLDGLADKAEATSSSIIDSFKQMGDVGVDYFINRLTEAHSLLSSLGSTQFSVSGIDFSAGKKELDALTAAQEELTAAQERYNEQSEKENAIRAERGRLNKERDDLYSARQIASENEEIHQTIQFVLQDYENYNDALKELNEQYNKAKKKADKYHESLRLTGTLPKGVTMDNLDSIEKRVTHLNNAIFALKAYREEENILTTVERQKAKYSEEYNQIQEKRNLIIEQAEKKEKEAWEESRKTYKLNNEVAAAKKKVAEAEAALGRAVAQNKPALDEQTKSLKQVSTQATLTAENVEQLAAAMVSLSSAQATVAPQKSVSLRSWITSFSPDTEKMLEEFRRQNEERKKIHGDRQQDIIAAFKREDALEKEAAKNEKKRYDDTLRNMAALQHAQEEAAEAELEYRREIAKNAEKIEEENYQATLARGAREQKEREAREEAEFNRQKAAIEEQNRLQKEAAQERERAEKAAADAAEQRQKEAIDNMKEALAEQDRINKERERQAKLQAKYDSESRRQRYQSYVTSYDGALRTAEKADTIAKRTAAIKNLQVAMSNLSKTDADYERKLKTLKDTMALLNHQNNVALGKTKAYREEVRKLNNESGLLTRTADQLKRAFYLMFSVSQIRGYVSKLVTIRGEFDLQNRALAAILQNKDEADRLFGQITELAVRSPFQLKELVTYTKQLAAYRVESDKLFETTKMLADVSAGLGVGMDRLILAYGQVKAANYLRGTELRQFSEAGINILGELATYFGELEGRAVSVGEVFERVSKRMVTFADVEVIFERITSKGGAFYQMQEQQAKSVAGMVSNLKDSIEIMLNEIGKANDGAIKASLGIIKGLIDNYKILINVLSGVGVAFSIYAVKAAVATAANYELSKSMNPVEARLGRIRLASSKGAGVLQKLGAAFASVGKFLKSNLWLAAAAAITLVVKSLADHNKEVKAAKEQYDVLSRSINKSIDTLGGMVKQLNRQEEVIASVKDDMSKLEEGTDEYTDAAEKLNNAEKEKVKILNKLKVEYPEIYAQYVQQGNKVEELTQAQEAYNAELRNTLALNYLMKQGESFFDDGIFTDYKDLAESHGKFASQTEEISSAYTATVAQVRSLLSANEDFAKAYEETFTNIIESQQSDYDKLLALRKMLFGVSSSGPRVQAVTIAEGSDKTVEAYVKALTNMQKSVAEADKETTSLINSVLTLSGVDSSEAFKQLAPEAKEAAKTFAKSYVESIPNIKDEFIQQFVNERFEATLGIKFKFSSTDVKELSDLGKDINKYIEESGFAISLKIKDDEATKDYFEGLRDKFKENEDLIKKLQSAERERFEMVDENGNKVVKTNEQAIDALGAENKQIREILEAYGEWESKRKTKEELDEEAAKAAEKRLKDQISLIKEINAAYEKNREEMEDVEAVNEIEKAFRKRAEGLGLGGFLDGVRFDDKGVVAGLESLMESASPALKKIIEEELSEMRATLNIDAKVKNREELQNEIEDLFDLYAHFEELKDTEIGDDLIKSIFNVDAITLDDIAKKLEDSAASFKGDKGTSAYKDYLDRLAYLRRKQQEKDAKEMVKYLKKHLDEVEAIQQRGAKSVSYFEALFNAGAISAEQFGQIVADITKETRDNIAKVNLDKFKESSIYIKAMGELAAYSREELSQMANQLKSTLANNAKNMGVDEIREYQEAIERIIAQMDKMKSPAEQNNIAELLRLIELQEELNTKKKDEKDLEEEKARLIAKRATLEKTLAAQRNAGDSLGAASTAKELQATIEQIQEIDGQMIAIASDISVISAEVADLGEGMVTALAKAQKIVNEIVEVSNATTKIFDDIKNVADSFGVDTDTGSWAKASIAMETMGGVTGELSQGLANFASGNYAGALANVVGAITKVVVGFNKMHDQQYAEIIAEQTKRVENLQRAYENLQKQVDNIMSLSDYRKMFRDLQDNIEARIEAEEAIIAAEQAKKDSDEEALKEANDRIQALLDESKETTEKMLEGLGGFGSEANMSSAAQEFADAWLSAYKETGDGLDALTEKWDDYIDNVVAKQLMLKGSEMFLKPIMQMLDGYLADSEYTTKEAQEVQKKLDELMPKLNEYWKSITAGFDIKPGEGNAEYEMSGLQRGIQAVTEETAQALEALLNSVRFYVADTNMKVASLASFDPELNPLLAELKLQTTHLKSLDTLMKSVVKTGHPQGESGIRVFTDIQVR